ncbi:MAG: lactate utilization protein C [Thermodesulfobacteriota bacterium]
MANNSSRDEILSRVRTGLYGDPAAHYGGTTPSGQENRDFSTEAGAIRKHNIDNNNSLLEQFIEELLKVNSEIRRVRSEDELMPLIMELIRDKGISSFSMWGSDYLRDLGLKNLLKSGGLKQLEASDKNAIAQAGIGITEVDYAIADTGTLVLLTDGNRPRSVSLLPPIHLAIVRKAKLVSDISELFIILKQTLDHTQDITSCMTFITGPSRTADIELNLTLGVHGPKELHVLITP